MAYSEAVVKRAKERLNREKTEAEENHTRKVRETYEAYPRVLEIDRQLRVTVAEAMAACFRNGTDPQREIDRLRDENLNLQWERGQILDAAGLGADYLDEAPICALCGGTGYQGSAMCECLKELCRQEQKKELSSLLAGKEKFDAFNIKRYSDRIDPAYGISPRENMTSVFRDVKAYAQEFVPGKSGSMLFSGGTGLGKTFLSACVARYLVDTGVSVTYETAVRIFEDFENKKFRRNEEERGEDSTEKYLLCDLLIMDDLGTELTTQYTQSVLYTIINTRLMDHRATIISTNLTMNDIAERYTPQIYSRLNGMYELVYFFGSDLRTDK